MATFADFMPLGTVHDPAEDPPTSVDPLGTTAGAEQLAEILFPGFTVRMWRARFLTFAAMASHVSDEVVRRLDGREEYRLPARLAVERLFVSAMARREASLKRSGVADNQWKHATRRVPGIGLARSALANDDLPLSPVSFLKGQVVNGPFGVIARLARRLGIIDESADHLVPEGQTLFDAWLSAGGRAVIDVPVGKKVAEIVRDGSWPPRGWAGWDRLADQLNPDEVKPSEIGQIYRLLMTDATGIRPRMLDLLQRPSVLKRYREAGLGTERTILLHIARQELQETDVDRHIRQTIQLIEAYEQVAGLLESAFRLVLWGLTHHQGQANPEDLAADKSFGDRLDKISARLPVAAQEYRKALAVAGGLESGRILQLRDDIEQAAAAGSSPVECLQAVMRRHQRVQHEKRKGTWVQCDNTWTLMPSFGDSNPEPWQFDGKAYLHSMRVVNAFSILADLDKVPPVEADDGQA